MSNFAIHLKISYNRVFSGYFKESGLMPGSKANQAIQEIKHQLAGLKPLAGLEDVLGQAENQLDLVADRLAHPRSPLVVAVCGPTGAGKSHLVNFLAGGPVSPSSYRRPSTAAPVLIAPEMTINNLDRQFLPDYEPDKPKGEIVFQPDEGRHRLYLVAAPAPSWAWPSDLAIIDTPDFDSVRLDNQAQARDLARRADALILVTHQAKYADQSTWDFLLDQKSTQRPLLIILNRVTAAPAVDDFQRRLNLANLTAPVVPWPEETAVGQVNIMEARRGLTNWLEDLGRRGPDIVTTNGRLAAAKLDALLREEVARPLAAHMAELDESLTEVRRVTRQWLERPLDRVSLNLPGDLKETLVTSLGEVVRRSDLWAKPRRLLSLPFTLASDALKKIMGKTGAEGAAERQLAANLVEAAREALVAAGRAQARELAAAAPFLAAGAGLDLTPDEIRALHQEMSQRLDNWLKEETEALLKGLPVGQKAIFYLVQFMHAGLVAGLWLQTGGLPGTEVLVGGALGPVISKLTGTVISNESLNSFEKKVTERHQKELAAIFQIQGERYEQKLIQKHDSLLVWPEIEKGLEKIEQEARRVWP